jgi:hypothetical protein
MNAGLEFTKRKPVRGKAAPVFCDHHKVARSASWKGCWLGYPVGNFCTPCKKEWQAIIERELGLVNDKGDHA